MALGPIRSNSFRCSAGLSSSLRWNNLIWQTAITWQATANQIEIILRRLNHSLESTNMASVQIYFSTNCIRWRCWCWWCWCWWPWWRWCSCSCCSPRCNRFIFSTETPSAKKSLKKILPKKWKRIRKPNFVALEIKLEENLVSMPTVGSTFFSWTWNKLVLKREE